jgi:hypothetical protein
VKGSGDARRAADVTLGTEAAAGLVAAEAVRTHEELEIVVAEREGQLDPRRRRQFENLGLRAPAKVVGH